MVVGGLEKAIFPLGSLGYLMRAGAVKVRVRGKYATALTKTALDLGFDIVQASDVIIDRFNLDVDNSAPNVTIKDSERVPGGLVFMGDCDAVDEALNGFLRVVEYGALVWRSVVPLHRVVIGVIKDSLNNGYIVDIGGAYAELRGFPGYYRVGDAIPVYVMRTRVLPKDIIMVMPGVRVDTHYVSIFPGSGNVLFSSHIKDPEAKSTLLEVGLRYVNGLRGYSIKWRSSAQFLNREEAVKEVEYAVRVLNEVEVRSRDSEPYTVLQDGECIVEVILGGDAKIILDNMRNSVMPTIIGHHTYKTFRRNTALLDLVEALLSHCSDRVGFSSEFMRQLMSGRYRVGIVHIRPNGDVLRLGVADVLRLEPSEVVLVRRLRDGGYLDGLGIPKAEGDLAITCTSLGSNYLIHVYTDGSLRPKGIYANVNTPVEFTGSNIFYVDLAVDVVKAWDSGEVRVVDYDEYMSYVKMGIIPQRIQDRVSDVMRELQTNIGKLGEDCLRRARDLMG